MFLRPGHMRPLYLAIPSLTSPYSKKRATLAPRRLPVGSQGHNLIIPPILGRPHRSQSLTFTWLYTVLLQVIRNT